MTHALTAVGVFAAIALAIFGLGLETSFRFLRQRADAALELAVAAACGTAEVVLVTMAAGYARALYPPLLAVLGVTGGLLLLRRRTTLKALASQIASAVQSLCRLEQAFVGVTVAAFLGVLGAGLRHPLAIDEVEYHWAAPLYWASLHRWAESPFKLTNGPAFMEWLYTLPALTGSYEAAHWLHALTLGILLLATASAALSLGANWVWAVAAVASIPLALQEATWAYNDVAAAAFAMVAFALVVSPARARSSFWLAGVALAAAASVKLFLLAAIPAVGLALFMSSRSRRSDLRAAAIPLVAVPALTIAVLALRTRALTGRLTDSQGLHLAHYGDPGWQISAGYVPDLRHTPLLALEPFFTGLIGNMEPYGGRTGVVLLLFLPVAVCVFALRPGRERDALAPLAAALVFLFGVGLVFPRTRYLLFAYVLFVLFVFAVLSRRGATGTRRSFWVGVLATAVVLGMLDAAHVIFRGLV